jgi:hypothetical protein
MTFLDRQSAPWFKQPLAAISSTGCSIRGLELIPDADDDLT